MAVNIITLLAPLVVAAMSDPLTVVQNSRPLSEVSRLSDGRYRYCDPNPEFAGLSQECFRFRKRGNRLLGIWLEYERESQIVFAFCLEGTIRNSRFEGYRRTRGLFRERPSLSAEERREGRSIGMTRVRSMPVYWYRWNTSIDIHRSWSSLYFVSRDAGELPTNCQSWDATEGGVY